MWIYNAFKSFFRCHFIKYDQLLALSHISFSLASVLFFFCVQSSAPCPPDLRGLVCNSSPLRSWSNCRLNGGGHADICLKVYLPLQWSPTTQRSLCASVCIHHIFCDCLFGKEEVNCLLPGNLTQWQWKKPSSSHVNSKDTQREQNDLWRSSVVTICRETSFKDWDASGRSWPWHFLHMSIQIRFKMKELNISLKWFILHSKVQHLKTDFWNEVVKNPLIKIKLHIIYTSADTVCKILSYYLLPVNINKWVIKNYKSKLAMWGVSNCVSVSSRAAQNILLVSY